MQEKQINYVNKGTKGKKKKNMHCCILLRASLTYRVWRQQDGKNGFKPISPAEKRGYK